jgi:hypothetical protein
MRLLLLLLPLFTFAQFDYGYPGFQTVELHDDLYIEPVQDAEVIATSDYYFSTLPSTRAQIIDSFESESDFDAIIEANWKSDYITRPGELKRDALVKGVNNKYYIVRWKR